jgi:hypothetical protein
MEKHDDIVMGLADKTGALMMINKRERELLRSILAMSMRSASAKDWVKSRLGPEYLEIGTKLLGSMAGRVGDNQQGIQSASRHP